MAEEFVASGRPMSEASIRGLHAMIAAGETFAGVYRQENVEIGGSTHRPPESISVPPLMCELTEWIRSAPAGHAILKAAVAHAWLTHIHPFKDGNGRVARLVANIVLAQEMLPPAIVKARTHRSRYLDVLSGSDPGGDILPVAGLFLDTLRKYAREMNKPGASRRVFAHLMSQRGNNLFEWFSSEVDHFLSDLQSQLFTLGVVVTRMDALDQADFADLMDGSRDKTLVASAGRGSKPHAFIFLEAPTSAMRSRILDAELLPSLGFAMRNDPNRLLAFRRASPAETGGLLEVWIQTIFDQHVTVRLADRARTLVWEDAVQLTSTRLAQAM